MNNERRAAILLVSLAPEVASKVMQYLGEDEIETLTLHIANLTRISAEERDFVLENFYDRFAVGGEVKAGGLGFG
jgi:flagellar motor switch protein FliG